tara:strand:+ start:164 stop:415 length:252 start_codon:yes stop_codon:yes gene_type:complete
METKYFYMQSGETSLSIKCPAVLVPDSDESGYLAFFMKPGAKDWSPAGMGKISDWYENGSTLTKSEFEDMFGTIGGSLPNLSA